MIAIKQLTLNGEIFLPLTSAEAVVVKQGLEILTLDKFLQRKQISTPENSGLIINLNGYNTIISHKNNIEPSEETPKVYKTVFDSTGHISNAVPTSTLKITAINKECVNYNGNSDLELKLGDDFVAISDNTIKLNWVNI